jgi:hypothetical protein
MNAKLEDALIWVVLIPPIFFLSFLCAIYDGYWYSPESVRKEE